VKKFLVLVFKTSSLKEREREREREEKKEKEKFFVCIVGR